MLTVGSLFSGIGGIELGLERIGGFRTIWQCENNAYASAVLKKHWPSVPNLGDVTEVDWNGVEKPDIVCGGFPCQDISYAGKGAGIKEGTRSRLWFEFHKAVRILRPRYALVENVSALSNRGLDVVLASLAEIGYDVEWFPLQAAQVGAPHRRERIFIIATDSHQFGRLEHERREEKIQQPQVIQLLPREGREPIVLKHDDRPAPSNANCCGHLHGQPQIQPTKTRLAPLRQPQPSVSIADAMRERCGRRLAPNRKTEDAREVQGRNHTDWPETANTDWERRSEHALRERRTQAQRTTESSLIADTVSNRACRFPEFAPFQDVRRVEELFGRPDLPEPLIRRGSYGLSEGLDTTRAGRITRSKEFEERIKCLGNAVVPACAQLIGEAIMELEAD